MKIRICVIVLVIILIPYWADAQEIAGKIRSLQEVLEELYADMLPLCSRLIGVGRGIAGFAATWYIAARVWGHIARAEPVDFYPLFRPFVLGFAILVFPSVIAMINGVMKPTVTATAAMVTDSDKAVAQLLQMKEDAIKKTAYWQMYAGPTGAGDRDKWYKYHYDAFKKPFAFIAVSLLHKVTNIMSMAGRNTVTGGAGATGTMVSDVYGDARSLWRHGQEGTMGDYFKEKLRGK